MNMHPFFSVRVNGTISDFNSCLFIDNYNDNSPYHEKVLTNHVIIHAFNLSSHLSNNYQDRKQPLCNAPFYEFCVIFLAESLIILLCLWCIMSLLWKTALLLKGEYLTYNPFFTFWTNAQFICISIMTFEVIVWTLITNYNFFIIKFSSNLQYASFPSL